MNIRDKFFNRITPNFEVMTKIVLRQIRDTIRLIEEDKSEETYDELYHNERIIDSMDVKLRNEVINVIVLYSPRAGDLRKIMAYYDMTAYLERIGDLLINITGFLQQTDRQGTLFSEFKKDMAKLLETTGNMTQNAIFAFTCEDNKLARETIDLDDTVDVFHQEIVERLKNKGEQALSKQQLTDLLCLSSISYNIERIGDNATNIAEAAIYLIEGKNIKHSEQPGTDILLAGSEG